MPKCLGCGHGVVDHGDRAVIPCAQTIDVEGAVYQWQKIRCFCEGWNESDDLGVLQDR